MASFDGETFDDSRDSDRLHRQLARVFELMSDNKWRTLGDIEEALSIPQASISARLRDFRKSKFGGHTVDRVYVERGLWRYRLTLRAKDEVIWNA
jgi:hypothetical protein